MIHGQIVRIKCENVLTYDFIEIFPCEKLNLIIGVNGSGKSTLISAIILGLGGNPAVVGRATELSKYVKLGRSQATIEIELFNADGNDVITRHYNIHNESKFLLNGRNISTEKIQKLMRKYHIQINNLCQILPQEKLEQFAKMNDHERLENTLKTVGNPKLSNMLDELKNSKGTQTEVRRKLDLLKKDLADATSKKEALEAEAKMVKEKEFLIECLRLLKQRRIWQYYFHTKQAVNKIDNVLNVKKNICQNIVQVLKKCRNDAHSSLSNVNNQNEIITKTKNDLSHHFMQTKKNLNEISIATDNISDIKTNFTRRMLKFKNQEKDMTNLRNKIADLQKEIINVDEVEPKIQKINQRIQAEREKVRALAQSKDAAYYNLETKTNELNAINVKLSKINTVKDHKMKFLERSYRDSWKGMNWLDENKNIFSDEVYGPMFLYVTVNDINNAKYVEGVIGNRDLTAFICKRREDTTTLLKELKDKQKLKINVVTALEDGVNIPPSTFRIEQLERFGFHSFVSDFLDGPDIILKFLILMYNLHNIPVGDSRTFKHSNEIPSSIKLYFTDTLRVSSKIVSSTKEKIESSSEIHEACFLRINVNLTDTEELQNKKRKLQTEVNKLREECEELDRHVTAGDNQIKELNNEINKLKSRKYGQSKIENMIKDKMTELRKLENSVIDLTVENSKYRLEVRLELDKISNKYLELSNLFKSVFECSIQFQREKINKEQIETVHQKNMYAVAEFVQAIKKEADSLKKLELKKKKLLKLADVIRQFALKCTNGVDPRSAEFKNRKMFFKLNDNVVILIRLINKFQAKINCLGGSNEGLRVFVEYKRFVKEMVRLKAKIEKKEGALLHYSVRINETKQAWLNEVEQLISTINRNFSRFFANMNCAGEVTLFTGDQEGEEDYNKYGIHIKVKFRDADDLQILSAQVQSGGERAVSVAIYLLSLQELTTVPFRCIDEINQGMDADNERRIFNLISNATEDEHCTQYFLLTPKLLLNLTYTKFTNIFCILNGVGSVSHNKALGILAKHSQRSQTQVS